MGDNLFKKVDDVSDKVDDVADKVDDLSGGMAELNRKVDAMSHQRSYTNINYSGYQQNTIRNFINRAHKEYMWNGPKDKFNKTKNIAMILMGAMMLSLILGSIFTSFAFKTYSTFTLFENIWLIAMMFVMKKIICSKYEWDMFKCLDNSIFKEEYSPDNLLCFGKLKFRYTLLLILTCLGTIGNLVIVWDGYASLALSIFATIFEIIGAGLSIYVFRFYVYNFLDGYWWIKFTARNDANTEDVCLVGSTLMGMLLPEKEFYEKFSWMK